MRPMKELKERPLMQTLSCKFDMKELSEEGRFSGYLSVFGNKDNQGDIVVKGAFKQTLLHKKQNDHKVPILFGHDQKLPIGVYDVVEEDTKGLYVEGQLNLGLFPNGNPIFPQAWIAFESMKSGAMRSQSIGYLPVAGKTQYTSEGRMLKELNLKEGSIVTIPANELCMIDSVKQIEETDWLKEVLLEYKMDDFNTLLDDTVKRSAAYRLRDDIISSFSRMADKVMWGYDEVDTTSDDKLNTLDRSMDQLKTVFLAWARSALKSEKSDDEYAGSCLALAMKSATPQETTAWQRLSAARDALNALLKSPEAPLGLGDDPDGSGLGDAPPTDEADAENYGELHSLLQAVTRDITEATTRETGGTTDGRRMVGNQGGS